MSTVKLQSAQINEAFNLPPLPQLRSVDQNLIQYIGTVDIQESVKVAQERATSLNNDDTTSLEEDYVPNKKYTWEIDPKKLVLKEFLARGTYGSVHRGIFDGKEVAGL